MVKTLEQKSDAEILIDLPIKRFSVLSHLENIEYCVEQIKSCSENNPVIGYFRMRSLGTREILHQVLPQEIAEHQKEEDRNFDYITLDKLLERKREIESGKYKLRNGLIVASNPSYSH